MRVVPVGRGVPGRHNAGRALWAVGILSGDRLEATIDLLLLDIDPTVEFHLPDLRLDQRLIVKVVVAPQISTEEIHVRAYRR